MVLLISSDMFGPRFPLLGLILRKAFAVLFFMVFPMPAGGSKEGGAGGREEIGSSNEGDRQRDSGPRLGAPAAIAAKMIPVPYVPAASVLSAAQLLTGANAVPFLRGGRRRHVR